MEEWARMQPFKVYMLRVTQIDGFINNESRKIRKLYSLNKCAVSSSAPLPNELCLYRLCFAVFYACAYLCMYTHLSSVAARTAMLIICLTPFTDVVWWWQTALAYLIETLTDTCILMFVWQWAYSMHLYLRGISCINTLQYTNRFRMILCIRNGIKQQQSGIFQTFHKSLKLNYGKFKIFYLYKFQVKHQDRYTDRYTRFSWHGAEPWTA